MRFQEQVYGIVRQIPKGKVVSYGQIAAVIGKPGAAQAVGWALHRMDRLPSKVARQYPWWRVINSRGMISTTCPVHTAHEQRQRLMKDGVVVVVRDETFWIDMKKYLWTRPHRS